MRYFLILILCLSMALMSACAAKQPQLTDEEANQLIPQPFIIMKDGKNHLVRDFNEFGQVMKTKPLAFSTIIRTEQVEHGAYHVHLRTLFGHMGYTQMGEKLIEVPYTPKGTDGQPVVQTTSKKKGVKKQEEPVQQMIKLYQQDFGVGNFTQQPQANNQSQQQPNGNNGGFWQNFSNGLVQTLPGALIVGGTYALTK